ncbi:TPA: GntR family transcriptional regulator, partial [Enterobacter kobei]|nr:GntR family transcriptional regulator [Enterobacter kobei]
DSQHQPIEYLVSVNHPQRVAFRINGGLKEVDVLSP